MIPGGMAVLPGVFTRNNDINVENLWAKADGIIFKMAAVAGGRYSETVSAKTFRYTHRVTYAECTLRNHIYYALYLDLLEAARGEFFRQLGAPLLQLPEQDTIFPVVECHLRYKSPARYDEVLTIELWPILVQGVRLNFGCRIFKEDKTVVME